MASRRWSGPVVVTVAVLLAGCATPVAGSGRPAAVAVSDPVAVVTLADLAMRSLVNGFRLSARLRTGSDEVVVDTRLGADSGDGTVTVNGEPCELRFVDDRGYARAGAAFWDRYDTIADPDALGDRWVALVAGAPTLIAFTNRNALLDSLIGDPTTFEGGARGSRRGVAVQVVESGGTELAIAAQEPHVLVEGSGPGVEYDFDVLTEPFTVTAPDDPLPFPR